MGIPGGCSAALAVEVDRCRLAVTRRLPAALAPLAAEHDVHGQAAYVFGMLRNLMPDRVVEAADVRRVFVYEEGLYDAVVPGLRGAGWVDAEPDTVALTATGREVMERLHEISAGVADAMWGQRATEVAACVEMLHRVLAATRPIHGAYAVLAPIYTPGGASECAVFAEQLSAVRFHRFDAHVDAWAARGLTVASVRELGEDDPLRLEIEADTNARNDQLWACLDPSDRDRLHALLSRLPGSPD